MATDTEKHTRGPWKASRSNCVTGPDWMTRGGEAGWVCKADGNSPEVNRANARLIALAPEMLDFVLDVMGGCCDQDDLERRALKLARKAGVEVDDGEQADTNDAPCPECRRQHGPHFDGPCTH